VGDDKHAEHRKARDLIVQNLAPLLKMLGEKYPGLAMSGFVWGTVVPNTTPDFLMRLGNVHNVGQDFIDLHLTLAYKSAILHATGQYEQGDITLATLTASSQDIADRLALSLMACPLELLPPQVQTVLNDYLESRTPREA
jgi:hypothetical protein